MALSCTRSPKNSVALLKIWLVLTWMRYRMSPPLEAHSLSADVLF